MSNNIKDIRNNKGGEEKPKRERKSEKGKTVTTKDTLVKKVEIITDKQVQNFTESKEQKVLDSQVAESLKQSGMRSHQIQKWLPYDRFHVLRSPFFRYAK